MGTATLFFPPYLPAGRQAGLNADPADKLLGNMPFLKLLQLGKTLQMAEISRVIFNRLRRANRQTNPAGPAIIFYRLVNFQRHISKNSYQPELTAEFLIH